MSQTLQNQIIMAKSMNGIVSLSDGAGSVIENGTIITGGLNATSITSDEYNTRGKSKMESTVIIPASSTPYTISYGTAENIVFTGAVVQTVILPVVLTENMGATFTIMRTSAVQMIIQAPSGYTFYDENNTFQSGTTLFSNNRIVSFTAINTGASPAMWAMTYSQAPNTNLTVSISNTQNITGTKSFALVNFNSLPSFIGTLGTVASNNFITKDIADSYYVDLVNSETIGGTKSFTTLPEFSGTLGTINSTSLIPRSYADSSFVNLLTNQTIVGQKSFSSSANFNGFLNVFGDAHFYLTAGFNGDMPYCGNPDPTFSDITFITRLYADSRYAELATDNTFSGTTTFTGSIIANALTITPTELGYLDGVSSSIQTQLNNRITLNTTQSITGIKQFNNNVGIFGFFVPNVSTSTTSMRIGLNSLLYNTSASCTDNIAWGTNALRGNASNPTYNLTKQSIAIGTNAGQSLYYADGTSATQTDNNVIIGYNAGASMFYSSYQNVLIGSNCGSSNNWIQKCVFIGANIASAGPYFLSDCTIIGANSLTNISDKSGVICVGSGNLPSFSGNSPVCIGVNCGTSALDNNKGIWIGGNCGNNVNSSLGNYFIGNGCGNGLISGGSCLFMGNDSNTSNNALTNTFIFGYTASCSTNDTFYVGGINLFTGKSMDLLIANKNRLVSQTDFTSIGTANLTFEMGEHINLGTTTSVVNLPLIGSNNVGARFTFYRDFTSTTCTLTASNAFGLINNTGASATTYVLPAGSCYATIVATAVQPTSGPAVVCWFLINEDINNAFSMIDAEVSALNYKTNAITYDDTSSPAYTSITSELRLNNNAVKFQTSATLTGVVGSLTTPLNSFYVLSGATGSLTLPAITTDLIGVRITFVKQVATGTWTLSRSSTDTFRFQGSTTTSTSIPMARTWTMCELMAETGVWNIINQNSGVDGYYYKDEISPTNITTSVASWTNPIYENYLVNNTANITISLPLSNQVFIGLVLRFRKIGTLTAQVVLNIQAGSGQAIKFAGATANTTTGTLLNASQTFASVMYISSNLWAVLG